MKPKEKHDDLLAETPEIQQSEHSNEIADDTQSRIQRRAYELWQKHGGSGQELDNWLQAEAEINAMSGNARTS
jgi:hypothetical protein